jgi:hypothetical protein
MLLCERSTLWAFLICIFSVYLDQLSASVLSFVFKHMMKGRPPDIMNCFGQDASRQAFESSAARENP